MKTMKGLMGIAMVVMMVRGTQAAPGDGVGDKPADGTGQQNMQGPELPADLKAQLDGVREARETLLTDLKVLLEANADATAEERAAIVEKWREDNAAALEAQRDSMQAVRLAIREWHTENRPARAKQAGNGAAEDRGALCDADADALMTQLKDQRQARTQAAKELKQDIEAAGSASERAQLVAQHREQRMEQMQQARDEVKTRREQVDRDESVAALRERLRDDAETLRSESRQRDREEAAERVSDDRDTVRDTLRDQVRDQDRDRLSE